ncbi:hypothetical protein ACFE04_010196 [Oxalis oulophora]
METNSNQQPNSNPTHPIPTKPMWYFFTLSLIVIIISISISITFTNNNNTKKIQLLKQQQQEEEEPIPTSSKSPYCVLWMAPFFSGGGYSSEAWSYILSIKQQQKNGKRFALAIEHHGDLESIDFWDGLPLHMKDLAFQLYNTQCLLNQTIVVCHSEPGAWYPPLFQTTPCPPVGYEQFMSVIGRTMFETDRVNDIHVKRCNKMDYVWVPTDFHVSTFVDSGVDSSKVVKIVQPIDVEFFDPVKYEPFDLSLVGNLVLGLRKEGVVKRFVFLSVFKWEYRKGWDILLKAYFSEFSAADGVALYLLTNPYHSDRDFGNKIIDFVEDSDLVKPVGGWAPIYVIDTHIAQIDLPKLYKAADAFVLPSRGEGWGRPLVEAMAMSLPVIATNWSGPTEYLTKHNSYPLPVDKMSEVEEGPFEGHLWAEPSVNKLQVLMRDVMSNAEKAKAKGRKAREDMIRRFSPAVVAKIVTDSINDILNNVTSYD